ncbi:MAG TPA: DUF3084 domain-containing protein [bacterium]|nr:DUF3084 domain-containing protein [bacterium]
MSYWWLYVAVLVLVSAGVAFLGDLLGRNIGKRRIKLFGLRPRNTAILITSLTGGLITLLTIGVMLLTNSELRKLPSLIEERDVQIAKLNDQIAEQDRLEADLRAREDALLTNVAELTKQRDALEQQRVDAQAKLEETERALATTTTAKEQLEAEATRLRNEITGINRKLAQGRREIEANERLILAQETQLRTLQQQTTALAEEVRTYQEGDIVIDEGARVAAKKLDPASRALSEAQLAGSLPSLIPIPSGKELGVAFTPPSAEDYRTAAAAIRSMAGQPILILRAAENGVKGGTVRLTADVQENKPVFRAGEEIFRKQYSKSIDPPVEDEYRRIFDEVRRRALGRGIVPLPEGSIGGFTTLDISDFYDVLRGIRSLDTLVLTATEDIMPLDALESRINFTWEVEPHAPGVPSPPEWQP